MGRIFQIFSTCFILVVLQVASTYSLENHELSYRLPDNLYPEFYNLEIMTNIADLNQNFTFQGRVSIQLKVRKPTKRIILHSKNLEIDEEHVVVMVRKGISQSKTLNEKARLERNADDTKKETKESYNLKILNHCYHDDFELYIVTVSEELRTDQTYTVIIPYRGLLNQELNGYYRSSYKDLKTQETRWLAVTQFESTDARRAFPCFDEPSFKARFQVNLGHINTRTSISNMRIMNTKPIDNMENWVWDQYEVTVPMSTYLVAFVVSDLDNKVSQKSEVLFRIWARKDAIDQVNYALDVGPRVLEYFGNYFGVKYPLPKVDMIAVPDFSSGAMENWGLITYREVALLYDPLVSSASSQPYVASVVAHELAHQWFGNLVTMKWWTDLWLNEGFATYVAALGVNYLHPEWNSLDEDVVELMTVFNLDSLKSSHPISVPIGHPREIPQIFDVISYKKGSFVLRMMNLFLGEGTFKAGVSNYLKKHSYQNAEQDDLWQCLTEEAHKAKVLPEYITVKQIMDSWTLQTGYPLITVTRNYKEGTATVYQEIYLSDRASSGYEKEIEPETLKNRWWVPLSYTWESEADFNNTHPKEWMNIEQNSVVIQNLPKDDWVLFNIKISGLYKVKYDVENWNKLITTLHKDPNKIQVLNRIQLIEDSLSLAKTGDINYDIPFNILTYMAKENEYLPWKAALKNLGFVDKMLKLQPTYSHFRQFMRNLLEPIYKKTSGEKHASTLENLTKIKHQTLIASWACKFEVGDCKETSIILFNNWMFTRNPETENPVPKDFRSHVYCTAIKYGGEKEWNFLWKRYLKSNVGNEKILILSALSCTREISLLSRFLEWSINENSGIRKQDSPNVFLGVARGDVGYSIAKSFFENRVGDIYNFYGSKSTRIGNYIGALSSQITELSDLHKLTQFTRKNERFLRLSKQAVMQGLESAQINIQWRHKFYDVLVDYLKTHKAAQDSLCDL